MKEDKVVAVLCAQYVMQFFPVTSFLENWTLIFCTKTNSSEIVPFHNLHTYRRSEEYISYRDLHCCLLLECAKRTKLFVKANGNSTILDANAISRSIWIFHILHFYWFCAAIKSSPYYYLVTVYKTYKTICQVRNSIIYDMDVLEIRNFYTFFAYHEHRSLSTTINLSQFRARRVFSCQ